MTEDIVERLRARRESVFDYATQGAEWQVDSLCAEAATTIESLRAQLADAREKVKPIEGDNLREAICNSIPYVNTHVVQAAIDGDFSNSPQWIWRNHENGVVGFGRWPHNPDAAPYIRADLICAALARMSTSHALGFKAGIEAGAEAIEGIPRNSGCSPCYGHRERDAAYEDAVDAITSLPTPPSMLPEILEAMRPVAREAESYGAAENAGKPFPDALKVGNGNITVGHLRTLAAMFTKLGGKIDG